MNAKVRSILRLCLDPSSSGKELALASLGCLLGSFLLLFAVQLYTDSQTMIGEKEQGSSFFTLNKKVQGGLLLNLSTNNKSFTQDEIEQIKQIEGVEDLGSFSRNHFPLTIHVWPAGKIGLGSAARADLFFEAIPNRFLDQIPDGWDWEENDSIVPIIVPKFYLDLWNFGLAPSRPEYPALSLEAASSMPVEIWIGEDQSSKMIGRFVAFSKRINSVLVPQLFLEWANRTFADEPNQKYFFVWKNGEITSPPMSFTDLKNLAESSLDKLVVSPIEEPAKQILFQSLSGNQSEDNQTARLIVQVKDSEAQIFSDTISRVGYETNREMPQSGWIHQIASFLTWGTGGLGALLSILSIGTFTSSFKLMIAQSSGVARDLTHLGFSEKQISWIFFQKFSKLFGLIWVVSLLFCFAIKEIVQSQIKPYGLATSDGLSWITLLLAILYAAVFIGINYQVIRGSVSTFCQDTQN
jgi:hypothetical protein